MDLTEDFRILYSCYYLFLLVYGCFIVAIECTNSLYLLIFLPLFIYGVIKNIALPRPSEVNVKNILGVDIWKQYKELLNNRDLNRDENIDMENDDLVFRTIAHRAAGLDAPENSISALKNCSRKGCNFVEIDLSFTKDGVPVVFHDATLDRMIGISGKIEDFVWDELQNYDLIFNHNSNEKELFNGEKIALFNEFIDICIDLGIRVFIDIKDKTDKVVNLIIETYEKHPDLINMSVVSSFNPFIVYKIRKRNPKIVCSIAWRPHYFSRKSYNPVLADVYGQKRYSSIFKNAGAILLDDISTWLIFNIGYYILGLSVILIHKDVISVDVISMWQKRNVRVIAWTVNSKVEKDFFANVLHIPYMTDSLDYNHIDLENFETEDLEKRLKIN